MREERGYTVSRARPAPGDALKWPPSCERLNKNAYINEKGTAEQP
jgi:hypothetical protein